MPWTTLQEFVSELEGPTVGKYQELHKWHKFEDELAVLMSAYRVYKRACGLLPGPFNFILLGDTKIRMDPHLLRNFGLLSGAGVQEADEKAMLQIMKFRAIQRGLPPPNIGTGAILSDSTWSPLLNDALVIGGVHGYREFHLADDRVDSVEAVTNLRARFEPSAPKAGDLPGYIGKWRAFFKRFPDSLWNPLYNVPRVLCRELLGLRVFGYEPQFSAHQLTFKPRRTGLSMGANFRTYLSELGKAGMFSSGTEKTILANISSFLFHTPDAL
jgi:hypothetical protein